MVPRFPNYPQENELARQLVERQRHAGQQDLQEPRFIEILSTMTAPRPDAINGWRPYQFDYPCMIKLVYDGGGTGSGQRGVVFAQPFRVKDAVNGIIQAIRSYGGKLWIPYPGKWWLQYYRADATPDRAIFGLVYDDTCGAMAHERGIYVAGFEEDIITVASGAATNLLMDEMSPQTCDGQIVQNIGANDIWWKKGAAADNPANVGDGGVIPPGGSLELVGDLAYPWRINARADGADTDVKFIKVVS